MQKRNKKIKFIAWLIVLIVLVLLLIRGIFSKSSSGLSFGGCSFGGYSYPHADHYHVGEFSLEEEIDQLEVHWIAGSVKLVETDKDYVYAEESAVSDDDKKLRYLVENGKLVIQFQKPKMFSLTGNNLKKDLTVYVPERMAQNMRDVKIETVSSSVKAEQFKAQEFEIETVSGKVELADIHTNTLQIDSVSGAINGSDIEAETADVETVSGGVTLSGSFSEVDANSVSGKLSVCSDIMLREADFETVSGSVNFEIPECEGFTAEMDSVSGNMNMGFSAEKNEKKWRYGNGKAEYSFNTVSGDVKISKNTKVLDCEHSSH